MEEIRGCDSASTNAIQAGLACPRQFLTAGTLPAGLGLPCPAPAPSLRAGDGIGQDGGIPAGVKGHSASWGARSEFPTRLLLSLWGALLSGCCRGSSGSVPPRMSRGGSRSSAWGLEPWLCRACGSWLRRGALGAVCLSAGPLPAPRCLLCFHSSRTRAERCCQLCLQAVCAVLIA